MRRIYLDNCLTTRPDAKVLEAMMPYLTHKFYFPGNFFSTSSEAKQDLWAFKTVIAESLGASPDEIHLTCSGTSANNIAIKGYILANAQRGNHIICSEIDYPDILTNAAFFEESGFEVTYLSADQQGLVDLEQLRAAIRPDTILVMTTLANHILGTIQPVPQMRAILKEKKSKAALFVDAAHAYGRMLIDVKTLGADILTISAHKIHGPQGAGALYVKKGIMLAQSKHGIYRMDEYDTGCISMANLAGMAKAVELTFSNIEVDIAQMRNLQTYLLKGLESNLGKLTINGALGEQRICHNLNISIEEVEGEALTMLLDIAGITVATGSGCASQNLKPNYVMMAVGKTFTQSHGSIKFTLSRMTTKDEIDFTIKTFTDAVKKLRKLSPFGQ